MRGAAVLSALMHLAILALVIFGLPAWFEPDIHLQPVSVQLVAMCDSAPQGQTVAQPEPAKPAKPLLNEPKPEPAKPVPEVDKAAAAAAAAEKAAAEEAAEQAAERAATEKAAAEQAAAEEAAAEKAAAEEAAAEKAAAKQAASEQAAAEKAAAEKAAAEQAAAAEKAAADKAAAEQAAAEKAAAEKAAAEQAAAEKKAAEKQAAEKKAAEKKAAEKKAAEKKAAEKKAAEKKAAENKAAEKKAAEKKDFASVLKNLTKAQPEPASESAPAEPQEAAVEPQSSIGAPKMTGSEMDALRRQIQHNWILSPSVIGADNTDMTVSVVIQLDPGGNVLSARASDPSRLSDPTYDAVARSIMNAAMKASPIRDLPPGKYSDWKDTTLTFNLKEYVNQ
jgi:TolA protein